MKLKINTMEKFSKKIVVRMAPSPTGNLHIGTARTTLYNYLFAKRNGGKFILRVEDTDTERSTKEFEQNQLDGLAWLGLTYDEFFRQSERTDVYVSYVKELIESGHAYISKEVVTEVGQRTEVIRFKNPNKKVSFEDIVRGTVEFDTTDLGDFVIARSIEEPLYHLAVVIDDHEMGVTHIIRGEDHISNTPRQILIQEAISAQRPIYAHIPLILDSDRKKLSKRKHGAAVWIDTYKLEGYAPSALLNFFAFLGWNPGGEREVYSLAEMTDIFDLERVQKGSAIFDIEKLKWFNKEHLKLLPEETIKKEIKNAVEHSQKYLSKHWNLTGEILTKSWKIMFERISNWKELSELVDAGEFDYLFEQPALTTSLLFWKDEKDALITKNHLVKVRDILSNLSDDNFSAENLKASIWDYATESGRGSVLWPLRTALSGKEKSPDPFVLGEILGKKETLGRIAFAEEKLS